MQAPRQVKGQVITAALLNEHASAIDALGPGINAPKDVNEPGVENEQAPGNEASEVWNFSSRVAETIRVENPDDSTQYVDVDRDTKVVFASSDGRTMTLNITY